jgi:uncharacterized membrane protein YjfL (UPF0719 family)
VEEKVRISINFKVLLFTDAFPFICKRVVPLVMRKTNEVEQENIASTISFGCFENTISQLPNQFDKYQEISEGNKAILLSLSATLLTKVCKKL